jgi:hypothetical protein
MGMPAARDIHEIVVAPEQARDAQRLLGLPVQAGDRVRFEVVKGHVTSSVPEPRRPDEPPTSARLDPAWQEWLQHLDGDDAVTPDVPAAVELARAREHYEV